MPVRRKTVFVNFFQGVFRQGSPKRRELYYWEVDREGLLWEGLPRFPQAYQWLQGTYLSCACG